MHPADTDKTSDVALYLFDFTIDGRKYGGHIPARSWEDAQSCVEKFGAKVIGRSIEEVYDNVCAICRGEITVDTSSPKPVDNFPDIIE